jgi:hypothetical protein
VIVKLHTSIGTRSARPARAESRAVPGEPLSVPPLAGAERVTHVVHLVSGYKLARHHSQAQLLLWGRMRRGGVLLVASGLRVEFHLVGMVRVRALLFSTLLYSLLLLHFTRLSRVASRSTKHNLRMFVGRAGALAELCGHLLKKTGKQIPPRQWYI